MSDERVELTVQDIDRDGLVAEYTAGNADDGHSFDNTGENVFLHVKNAGTANVTVEILTALTIDGIALPSKEVVVDAGDEAFIGPFSRAIYEQECEDNDIDNAVLVDLDDDTDVTLAAIALPKA